jgi:hypothetical protein
MSTSVPVPAQSAVVSGLPVNVYDDFTDLNQVLSQEQIEAFSQAQLSSFSPALAVILSIITLGIFPLIYYPLQHSRYPKVKPDDPSGAKAFWFQWIPLFNIYWYFVMWPRLGDRINFQYRLRGHPGPVNRQLPLWAFLLTLVTGVGWAIALYALAQYQGAVNRLAEGQAAQYVVQPTA